MTAILTLLITITSVEASQVTAIRVASGVERPLFVTAPPQDFQRLFVVEQETSDNKGRIQILDLATKSILPTPFLVIDDIGTNGGEQGLLGAAFHPDFAVNRKFYVSYVAPGDNPNTTDQHPDVTKIVEYQVSMDDPNVADTSSARTILQFDRRAQRNHNGGWIGFGPNDGLLYIASGDGGGANDTGNGHTEPGGNAQDITDNFMGKILRVDVNGDDFPADPEKNYRLSLSNPFPSNDPTGDDEIWAFGLRNPWRPSFDRMTGDFYLADVGQKAFEEINFQPASRTWW